MAKKMDSIYKMGMRQMGNGWFKVFICSKVYSCDLFLCVPFFQKQFHFFAKQNYAHFFRVMTSMNKLYVL